MTPAAEALAQQAAAVVFGTLAQRSAATARTIEAFLAATEASCLRIADVNLRQAFYDATVLDRSLSAADVLKLNDEELPIVAGLLGVDGTPEAALRCLLERYELKLAALTRGAAGSLLLTMQETSDIPGQAVTVVDSVGAGDAFTAALAVGMLAGAALADIHTHADAVARYVCTQAGATPAIPADLRGIRA